MMTTPAIIDQLVEVIKQHYGTSPLLNLRDVDAAITGMPESVQTALRHLEGSGIPRHALRSVAACLLVVRLSDRPAPLTGQDLAIQAMHAVMGSVVALDGGSLPFGFHRNDPDCCDFINVGAVEACLDLASSDHQSAICATARRIVGLCFVNLAASGQLAPLCWPNPRKLLNEIAALGTLFVEESPGYYQNATTPDDVWEAYSKALLMVEDHGWSAAGSLRNIIAHSPVRDGNLGWLNSRVLH